MSGNTARLFCKALPIPLGKPQYYMEHLMLKYVCIIFCFTKSAYLVDIYLTKMCEGMQIWFQDWCSYGNLLNAVDARLGLFTWVLPAAEVFQVRLRLYHTCCWQWELEISAFCTFEPGTENHILCKDQSFCISWLITFQWASLRGGSRFPIVFIWLPVYGNLE